MFRSGDIERHCFQVINPQSTCTATGCSPWHKPREHSYYGDKTAVYRLCESRSAELWTSESAVNVRYRARRTTRIAACSREAVTLLIAPSVNYSCTTQSLHIRHCCVVLMTHCPAELSGYPSSSAMVSYWVMMVWLKRSNTDTMLKLQNFLCCKQIMHDFINLKYIEFILS